jgi:hypothetical protein
VNESPARVHAGVLVHHRIMPSGAPMTLNTQSRVRGESLDLQDIGQLVGRREQLITIVATSLGVMIVAAIAVLMGMA